MGSTCRRNHQCCEAKRNLVDEAGGENRKRGERLLAKFCDAPMNGIDETAPSIGRCESSTKSRVIRSKKNDHERNKRDECNGESKQRGAAEFAESWVDDESEERNQWQHQPTGESLKRNRCKCCFRFAIDLGKP